MAITPLTDKTELIKRIGDVDRLMQFAQGSDTNITAAALIATDAFRSAALNRYSLADVDALTIATISPEAKYHIESLALEFMTSNGTGRPEEIKMYGDDARKWLSWVIGGTANISGLNDAGSGVSGSSGTSHVRYSAPDEMVFQRDAYSGRYNYRDPSI